MLVRRNGEEKAEEIWGLALHRPGARRERERERARPGFSCSAIVEPKEAACCTNSRAAQVDGCGRRVGSADMDWAWHGKEREHASER